MAKKVVCQFLIGKVQPARSFNRIEKDGKYLCQFLIGKVQPRKSEINS